MGSPYVGEIRLFGGNFNPAGWAFCNGQTMPISQNDTLFNLIGTTYGGDGQTTFDLPDLQGRRPNHQGQGPGLQNYTIGERAGVEQVTLNTTQIPSHNHPVDALNEAGRLNSPGNNVWAGMSVNGYSTSGAPNAQLWSGSLASSGSSQPHDNLSPFLAVSFIISLFGVYPSQS